MTDKPNTPPASDLSDLSEFLGADGPGPDLPDLPMCGRCYDFTDKLYPARCNEKPELLVNVPLGMYHCPDCGAMIMAGLPHPTVCIKCRDLVHPAYDRPEDALPPLLESTPPTPDQVA